MNIKSSKGDTTSNIQGKPHMLNSSSFSRNSASHKGMAGYKILNGKNLQPRLLYLSRISFKLMGGKKKKKGLPKRKS